jgi:hypothetical protein
MPVRTVVHPPATGAQTHQISEYGDLVPGQVLRRPKQVGRAHIGAQSVAFPLVPYRQNVIDEHDTERSPGTVAVPA